MNSERKSQREDTSGDETSKTVDLWLRNTRSSGVGRFFRILALYVLIFSIPMQLKYIIAPESPRVEKLYVWWTTTEDLDFGNILAFFAILFTICIAVIVEANRGFREYYDIRQGGTGNQPISVQAGEIKSSQDATRKQLQAERKRRDIYWKPTGTLLLLVHVGAGTGLYYAFRLWGAAQRAQVWAHDYLMQTFIIVLLIYLIYALAQNTIDKWKLDRLSSESSDFALYEDLKSSGLFEHSRDDGPELTLGEVQPVVNNYYSWYQRVMKAWIVFASFLIAFLGLLLVNVLMNIVYAKCFNWSILGILYSTTGSVLLQISLLVVVYCVATIYYLKVQGGVSINFLVYYYIPTFGSVSILPILILREVSLLGYQGAFLFPIFGSIVIVVVGGFVVGRFLSNYFASRHSSPLEHVFLNRLSERDINQCEDCVGGLTSFGLVNGCDLCRIYKAVKLRYGAWRDDASCSMLSIWLLYLALNSIVSSR